MKKYEITIFKFKDELHKGVYAFENYGEARNYALGIFNGMELCGKEPTGIMLNPIEDEKEK